MNIKITHSWLLEYLHTKATPAQIQESLSLSGPSVERVEVSGNETVYDIEITSNRIDTASVQGIAREAHAILPQAGYNTTLTQGAIDPSDLPSCAPQGEWVDLQLTLADPSLAPRAMAIVLTINPSSAQTPQYMKDRLAAVGQRSISPLVDITNYLMIECGQPLHVFEYDAFEQGILTMRLSKQGEQITTLDETRLTLPEGVIVIEEKGGKLQDMCGIMGGYSSRVTEHTKRVILFVQTYDKTKIRSAVMRTGHRTLAATYFEKGLDSAAVLPTFHRALSLLSHIASAQIISKTIDLQVPETPISSITLSHKKLESRMGMSVGAPVVVDILKRLGFTASYQDTAQTYTATPPSFRRHDVVEDVDLIEEVARIVGYHAIPKAPQPPALVAQPLSILRQHETAQCIRSFLKHQGGIEMINYSAVSRSLLTAFDLSIDSHLYITNSISEDFTYLRKSLIPSLAQNYQANQSQSDERMLLFEIGNTYIPADTDLPAQYPTLALLSNISIETMQGIVSGLLREVGLKDHLLMNAPHPFLHAKVSGEIRWQNTSIGSVGQLSPQIQEHMGIAHPVYVMELSLNLLPNQGLSLASYKKPNPYAVIKQHITLPYNKPYADIVASIQRSVPYIQTIRPLSRYKGNITLEILFNKPNANLTEKEVLEFISPLQTKS